MSRFRYRAVDSVGRRVRGQMDARNDADLEQRLKRMGLDLVALVPVRGRGGIRLWRGVGNAELVMFCFQMEALLRAGVPLLEGLSEMRDSLGPAPFGKVVATLIPEVEGGRHLSQALMGHPDIFNLAFIGMVRAGEQTGRLPEVFAHLAATLKWQEEIASETRRLLAYPAFVLVVVAAAAVFLMTVLVPQMVSFLNDMGQALPPETRLLLAVSGAFTRHGEWLAVLPLSMVAFGLALRHNPRVRYRVDAITLHLPWVGPVLHKAALARFARHLALMYQSGIPVIEAVRACQSIVANRAIAEGLEHICRQIGAGERMSESFRNTGLFPPLVVRMVSVGESTGTLDRALLHVGEFYDREVRASVHTLLRLLEPMLTLFLGGLLILIILAVLGPVYDMIGQLPLG